MPVGQTLKATLLHAVEHTLARFRRLKRFNCVDVVEHERQIEDAELLSEFFELGQRRRCKLDVALKHGFKNFVVVVKRGVREDLQTHLAVHLIVDPCFQQ